MYDIFFTFRTFNFYLLIDGWGCGMLQLHIAPLADNDLGVFL